MEEDLNKMIIFFILKIYELITNITKIQIIFIQLIL